MKFENIKWIKDKPETAYYVDEKTGKHLYSEKYINIVKEFLKAKDDINKLKIFFEKTLKQKWIKP